MKLKIFQIYLLFLILILSEDISYSQVLDSSNLPIIKINTSGVEIPNEPKIMASMQIIYNGPGKWNHLNDTIYNYNGPIGIEIRGSSSQMFPKKSYAVAIWTNNGIDTTASLLELPIENDWVLYAPYDDKSLMRDVLTYKLSNDIGRYASRTIYCELILNGYYNGIYVLEEKVKRDKNRVDISKLQSDENSGDNLTGGYIFKIDKYDGTNSGLGWTSPYPPVNRYRSDQTIFFQYDYPKNTNITQAQMQYIREYVTAFEDALYKNSYNDLVVGYRAYADESSMVDYALLNEISHNVDAYRLSTFIYKDKDSKGGKLKFGPVWDINLGYGNADYCDGGNSYGWAYMFNYSCNQDYWQVPFWWFKLFNDIEFRTLLQQRWLTFRQGPLKTENILSYIDSTALALDEARQRNFIRWPVLGIYIWPNKYVGNTYQDEINYLKNWIIERMTWLDQNLNTLPTAIENTSESSNLIVYPNPFSKQLYFTLPEVHTGYVTLIIYDVFGKELWSKEASLDSKILSWNGCDFEGNSLKKGIYIFSMLDGKHVIYNQKIIKTD